MNKCNRKIAISGYKSSCPPSESGNYGLDNIQTLNNEEHTHFLASSHYASEEHEYQALEPGHQPQSFIDSSPEFYAANNLIETKYNPHSYVKNYVRGKQKKILFGPQFEIWYLI